MSSSKPHLGVLLHAFFEEYLLNQRALSAATIKSYRDTLTLFLLFIAKDKHCKITRLSINDLTSKRVLAFLQHLEEARQNHIRTRNQRLAALKTFFNYQATQKPEHLAEAEQVAAIPLKRVAPAKSTFLLSEQIQQLFAQLPKTGHFALRDRTLLLFLYNTGARVQEVADLRVDNLQLEPPSRVQLHGKGGKWRVCPLWAETTALLKQLLGERHHLTSASPVFLSLQGSALTRVGIYKLVRRHTRQLTTHGQQPISPHSFRHTAAVHLLESGVDVNVIRAWLGHVSLETTNRYAEISLKMKAEALNTCEPPIPGMAGSHKEPRWRSDSSLLNWLQSL